MKHILLHATYSNKAKAIDMVGLRIGPKTKPGTGYCKLGDFDCEREEAYKQSEAVHEATRKRMKPSLPTRLGAVFFSPQEGHMCVDDPRNCVTGEDDWGKPIYDFGFGKDVMYAVDASKIPCKCGVGDTAKSDEAFGYYWHKRGLGSKPEETPEHSSARFWRGAKHFDWRTFDPYAPRGKDPAIELPEVWCPCAIPKSAIIRKFDKNHPLEEG